MKTEKILNQKQRSHRARAEYIKGNLIIWNKLKKIYKLNDEELYDLMENPCELNPNELFEQLLDKLQRKLEKKYNVLIEHDNDFVKVMAWS